MTSEAEFMRNLVNKIDGIAAGRVVIGITTLGVEFKNKGAVIGSESSVMDTEKQTAVKQILNEAIEKLNAIGCDFE